MEASTCAACRRAIDDALGDTGRLAPGHLAHLGHCAPCREHAALVAALAGGAAGGVAGVAAIPDWRAADLAIERAARIGLERAERRQFLAFIALASAAMAAWAWLGMTGSGYVLLGAQAASVLVLPFAGLAAAFARAKGAKT